MEEGEDCDDDDEEVAEAEAEVGGEIEKELIVVRITDLS